MRHRTWWDDYVEPVGERREHHDVRHFDSSRGRDTPWDMDMGGQWTMGDPGNWANPAGYSGPGSYADPGIGGGFSRHLGHLGPPVLSPRERAERDWRAGYGPFRGVGPKGYQRSDSRVLEDVCEALFFDGDVDACEIEVRVKDGEVSLAGTVSDRRQKRRAEDVVERVAGVKDVHNALRVA